MTIKYNNTGVIRLIEKVQADLRTVADVVASNSDMPSYESLYLNIGRLDALKETLQEESE